MKRSILPLIAWIVALFLLGACTTSTPAPTAIPPTAAPVVLPTQPPTETTAPTATTAPTDTLTPTVAPSPTPAPVVLEVSSPSGSKSLTLDEMMKLPVTEGQAGIKNSAGKITPPSMYKGVSLIDLVSQVGGLDPSMGVNIVAKDGYAMTFSYDQIMQGNFIAYDPATGDEKKQKEPLTVILAYENEGQPLPQDSDGTLKLVIVTPKNDQVTDGHWAVKWVTKIEIKPICQEWGLKLTGVITDVVDRNTFQSCAATSCHQAAWTDDTAQKWVGVPLWQIVGRMDDNIKHDGPAFNQALADAGYSVRIIATDGYSTTLSIADVKRNDQIVVVYQVNDSPLPDKYFPLRLVGPNLKKNQMVGQIAEVQMIFEKALATKVAKSAPTAVPPTATPKPEPTATATPAAVAAAGQADFSLTGLVEKELTLTEADLRKMDIAKITADQPKQGSQNFEGVRLSTLFAAAKVKPGATKLVFTAVDGYSVDMPFADVQACADCMVAFTTTPGKFFLVMPGMSGKAWVKDINKVEIQ